MTEPSQATGMAMLRDYAPAYACAAIMIALMALCAFAWNVTDFFEGLF